MKLPVNIANNIFKTTLYGYDEEVTKVKGERVTVRSAIYEFTGTIQRASLRDIQMVRDGQDLAITQSLHTDRKLSGYNATQNAVSTRQSFVIDYYQAPLADGDDVPDDIEMVFKVIDLSNNAKHITGGVQKYALQKYVNMDNNA